VGFSTSTPLQASTNCYGDCLTFLYIEDVGTSQETHVWTYIACYKDSFTFSHIEDVRTSQETHVWTTPCYRDSFTIRQFFILWFLSTKQPGTNTEGRRMTCGQRNCSLRALLSVFYTAAVTFHSSSASIMLTRLWTPFQTHIFTENVVAPGAEPGTSGSVVRNSDHRNTEAVST
jgi:hypothetical protein